MPLLRRTGTILAGLTAAGALFTSTAVAAPSWQNVPGPSPRYPGVLNHIDADGPNSAWAIGTENNGGNKTSVLRWNGQGWARQALPLQFTPTDITAASPAKAWAAGFSLWRAVGMYWNGATWTQVPYPVIGFPQSLSAATDGSAWAIVGINPQNGGFSTLLKWNGSAWVREAVPVPPSSSMTTVSARAANDVWVGGTYTNGITVFPLVMHWNGTAWKQIAAPGNWGTPSRHNTMPRILPVSATSVYALRSQNAGALLHWNGQAWREIPTPLGAQPYALTDDGAGGAWVVPVPTAATRATYLHWNGTAWTTVYGPQRAGTASLNDVDRVPGGSAVLGVGGAYEPVNGRNTQFPIIERTG